MRWAFLLGIVALTSVLAGCGLASTSGSTAGSSAPAANSTESATPQSTRDHVILNCNLVLSDADAAGLTPSLIPVPDFAPAAGTFGAAMVDAGGRPCGWGTDATTASLEVVVALPTAAEQTAAKAAASTGQEAPSLRGDTAYFQVADGVGRAQVFIGSYWIEVASAAFTTPEKASEVYSLVLQNLRSAGG